MGKGEGCLFAAECLVTSLAFAVCAFFSIVGLFDVGC